MVVAACGLAMWGLYIRGAGQVFARGGARTRGALLELYEDIVVQLFSSQGCPV